MSNPVVETMLRGLISQLNTLQTSLHTRSLVHGLGNMDVPW